MHALSLLLLAALLASCAGTPTASGPRSPAAPPAGEAASLPRSAAAGADAPETSARQLLVMLAPMPPRIVQERTGELALNYRLRAVASWPIASLGEPCVVFEVVGNRDPAQVARRLTTDPRVRSAEIIQTFEALAASPAAPPAAAEPREKIDPYAHLQYGAEVLRLAAAHRRATGKGVRVAVVDTGVDLDHPDLRGRIVKAGNFVDRGEQTFTSDVHGTAIAGVVAAAAGNDVGIVGVAPGADLLALKACWPRRPGTRQALCNSYTLARALDAAIAERAQVLNLSLGGPPDPLLARIVRSALDRGIVVVAAGAPEGADAGFPAAVPGVIAVVGSGPDGTVRAPPRRDAGRLLAAPGVDILTTVPRSAYDFFTGSSLAAAQVSGVAALVLEKNPRLSPAEVKDLIEKSARPLPGEASPGGAGGAGGLVDACTAVALASSLASGTPPEACP